MHNYLTICIYHRCVITLPFATAQTYISTVISCFPLCHNVPKIKVFCKEKQEKVSQVAMGQGKITSRGSRKKQWKSYDRKKEIIIQTYKYIAYVKSL